MDELKARRLSKAAEGEPFMWVGIEWVAVDDTRIVFTVTVKEPVDVDWLAHELRLIADEIEDAHGS